MILRRLMQHVRDQNWVAVGLDFMIVVVGVFVGLQVSNWSAAQADLRRGEQYAHRLAADLEIDVNNRRTTISYYDAVNASAERTIELLADPYADSLELVVSAYRSTEYQMIPQTRSTWDEIVGAGDLGLMPDRAVLDGLSQYFGADSTGRAADTLSTSALRFRVRSTIPHEIQKAIRAGCSDHRNADGDIIGFLAECQLDIASDDISAAADALRNDPELLPTLRYNFSALNSARLNMRGDIIILERVIALLSSEETDTP
jgi:hypothetical protein